MSALRESQGAWTDLARRAAGPGAVPVAVTAPLDEFLRLSLSDESYALPVDRVREIVRPRVITPLPRVPAAVLGAVALRGEVLQVLDLRTRLGLVAGPLGRASRVLVLRAQGGEPAAALVDAVHDVLRVPRDSLAPPPSGESSYIASLCAFADGFVPVLDVERLLDLAGHV